MKENFQRLFHNVEQNTDEWLKLRCGKITSSNFPKIMANFGKAFGPPAVDYARKKAHEIVTGKLDESPQYSNQYIEMGNEYEDIAREEYEAEKMIQTRPGGFFTLGPYGDSPDHLSGEKGCGEIKVVIQKTHWNRLEYGIDKSYKWQRKGHLFVGGLEWCDSISFCPFFYKPKRLHVVREYLENEESEMLEERLYDFRKLVMKYVEILKN